jgi:hypothetical protein
MKSATILGSLTFALVFFLALMPVQDTDSWMHLNIGRLIWEQAAIPETEPYVYTAEGEPFVYTSWLFAAIAYGVFKYTSYTGVVILKALIISAAFLVLFRDVVEYRNRPAVALFFVILCALIGQERFVVRPEIFMALFLALSVYFTNRFIRTNSRTVFLLPLIHLFWANIHSSAVLYLVPYLAVIGIGVASRAAARYGLECQGTPSARQLWILSGLLLI